MQALVAGDLDIVVTSAPNVVNPRLGGADTVMILSIIPTFIDHIISAPSITSPEQLRGKIGSVNRFGSISEMGLRLSLKRFGIDPVAQNSVARKRHRDPGGDHQGKAPCGCQVRARCHRGDPLHQER
jgi:hypothetical protein